MTDNATASRFGSINAGSDGTFANDLPLFLKVWAGEVLTAFEEKCIMAPLTMVRTIASGKTAQFPVTGKASAGYHTVGNVLLGTQIINSNEKTINVDPNLLSDVFVANFDEAVSHFEIRSIYTQQLVRALAVKVDKHLLQVLTLAARAAATITGGNGGSQLVDAAIETDGEAIYNALFDAQQALDEKDVDADNRYAAFKPAQFKLLARYTKIHDDRWGGTGSIADGDVNKIAGFKILKTNHLPTSVIAAESPAPNNTYNGTFTNTMGVCWHTDAVGTVKLRDVAMESEYQVGRQGTLMVAKMICGHGILRPECAVELAKA